MLVFSFAREKVLLNKCLQFLHQISCGEGRASQTTTVASLISHIYLNSSMDLEYGVESHMPRYPYIWFPYICVCVYIYLHLEKVISEGFFYIFGMTCSTKLRILP